MGARQDFGNACLAGVAGGVTVAAFGPGEAIAGVGFVVAGATGCGSGILGIELGEAFGPIMESTWSWTGLLRVEVTPDVW
jgi:hypothetical protein